MYAEYIKFVFQSHSAFSYFFFQSILLHFLAEYAVCICNAVGLGVGGKPYSWCCLTKEIHHNALIHLNHGFT